MSTTPDITALSAYREMCCNVGAMVRDETADPRALKVLDEALLEYQQAALVEGPIPEFPSLDDETD